MKEIPYLTWMGNHLDRIKYDLGTTELNYFENKRSYLPNWLDNDLSVNKNLEYFLASEYDASENNFLITPGATFSNFLAFLYFKKRTKKFLVEEPGYQPLYYTPRSLGVDVERIKRHIVKDFDFDEESLKNKLDEPSLLILTNRHNPTGKILDRDKLENLSEILRENDSYLLVDEVYSPYNYDCSWQKSAFGGPTAIDLPNTIISNSLTKFFGLGDLKIGWVGGDREIIKEMEKYMAHFFPVSKPSKDLARKVLKNKEKITKKANEMIRRNNELLSSLVDEIDLIGGLYSKNIFGFLRKPEIKTERLVAKSLKNNILIIPGSFFDRKQYFRISVAQKPKKAKESINRFKDLIKQMN